MNVLDFAASFASERTVALGVLAVQARQYVSKDVAGQAVPGLSVWSIESEERPLYHPSTGVYGFLGLKQGTHRIHIVDPLGRYLPQAQEVEVPDREAARKRLLRGVESADRLPDTAYPIVLVRPGIGYPLLGGDTAVWGSVRRPSGQPVPFARIRIRTKYRNVDTDLVTYTDLNGVYLARLAGERPEFNLPEPGDLPPDPGPGPLETPPADTDDADDTELIVEFEREITVHRLKNEPQIRSGSGDPLRTLPADFDKLDPDAPNGPYRASAEFELWPGGAEPNEPGPTKITFHVGRRARWDIVLT